MTSRPDPRDHTRYPNPTGETPETTVPVWCDNTDHGTELHQCVPSCVHPHELTIPGRY